MKTRPDESPLLDDVLAESIPAPDSLEPLLRAVRSRRRRAKAAPLAAAAFLVLAMLGAGILNLRNPAKSTPTSVAQVEPNLNPTRPVVEHTRTRILAASDRVSTVENAVAFERVASRPERGLRATDSELLALAGGRGVGLFRFSDGRAVLLTAGN